MRWRRARKSENVEDRRGSAPQKAAAFGGLGLIVVIVAALFGVDPAQISKLLGTVSKAQAPISVPKGTSAESDELVEFVGAVLGTTEDIWHQLFRDMGQTYREPTLVTFSDAVQSACGSQQAAVGPFYCPGDHKVYIDVSFYKDLRERHGAPGDFAQAYVIAHEVGHHIQNLLGYSEKVHRARGRVSQVEYNQLSVRLELQADFYAGVWAHYAEKANLLDPGDIEEALNAASAIGDDRLQRKARGYVSPESFTHGTSAQRMRWFRKGYETGDPGLAGTLFTTKNL